MLYATTILPTLSFRVFASCLTLTDLVVATIIACLRVWSEYGLFSIVIVSSFFDLFVPPSCTSVTKTRSERVPTCP